MNTPQVLLISMPFSSLLEPSLSLGLLKPALARRGIDSRVLYLGFLLAQRIGPALYTKIASGEPVAQDLVGEWFFSRCLFDASNDAAYIEDVLRGRSAPHRAMHNNTVVAIAGAQNSVPENFIGDLLHAKQQVASFLESCLPYVRSLDPSVILFSDTGQQQVASLALAKRIKEEKPEASIVFEGENCEGVKGQELLQSFPFVDSVVSGKGNPAAADVVERLLKKEECSGFHNSNHEWSMDSLEYPDYDDFFEQLKAGGFEHVFKPQVVFETSRGCWWGEISHCTFCGLNGNAMGYHSKSAIRALDELQYLRTRYPQFPVVPVDMIMDMHYFKDFIPALAEQENRAGLFYEIKSNLRKDQVRMLRDAGIRKIQPGIESLSSRILQLMGKGVTALQNIQMLKWCKEMGVKVTWNLLCGFPGEPAEEYFHMTKLIPALSHLQPPCDVSIIGLHRFSPNFEQAARFGLCNVQPFPAYNHVYSTLPAESVARLAHCFSYDYSVPQNVDEYIKPVAGEVLKWQEAYPKSELLYSDDGVEVVVHDRRPMRRCESRALNGLERDLYLFCETTRSLPHIQREMGEVSGPLESLLSDGFLIREGDTYLSLAIRLIH